MTLFRQLVILLAAVCLLVVAGSFVVTVQNSRGYLQEQLSSHAQDTATSLGLSLRPALMQHDLPLAETMVSAIFDRGYYRRIVLIDNTGKELLRREAPVGLEGVPGWFVQMVPLRAPKAYTEISSGWKVAGQLVVESHPGIAYRDLWRVAVQQLSLFASVMVLVIALAYLGLRWITRPLEALEEQAEALSRREFRTITLMPRTRELRRVVESMNRMTHQLSDIFSTMVRQVEVLRQQVFQDPVTGLANQAAFETEFRELLASSERRANGALLILQVADFAGVNNELGRDKADLLLQQIAGRFAKLHERIPESIVARRSGADFIAFLPGRTESESHEDVRSLFGSVAELPLLRDHPAIRYYIGAAFGDVASEPGELLPKASLAVKMAQQSSESGTHILRASPQRSQDLALLGDGPDEWKSTLYSLLERQDLQLHYQSSVDGGGKLLHKEVLVRLELAGKPLAAGVFLPLVEQYGWEPWLDRIVVRKVLAYLQDAEQTGIPVGVLSVNLSPYSLADAKFVGDLESMLSEFGELLPKLQFEVAETALTLAPQVVRRLASWLDERGSGLMLDRFAMRQNSLIQLGSLALRGLKVDGAFVREVETNADHRFLLTTLRNVAHSRDMLLLADSVESSSQWQVLKELKVDGGQGYLFGRPRELEPLSRGM